MASKVHLEGWYAPRPELYIAAVDNTFAIIVRSVEWRHIIALDGVLRASCTGEWLNLEFDSM